MLFFPPFCLQKPPLVAEHFSVIALDTVYFKFAFVKRMKENDRKIKINQWRELQIKYIQKGEKKCKNKVKEENLIFKQKISYLLWPSCAEPFSLRIITV